LEFSLNDGMQVDLKSEGFTPESRPNKDFTRDSRECNDIFGSVKGSQISEKY
jgi:hypothetical protein